MNFLRKYFENDPWADLYNLDGLTTVALTTDIDWAPDYATDAVLDLVAEAGYQITAFVTHDSPRLRNPPPFVEVGLHPDNTRPDPVHRFRNKLTDLQQLYPDAVGLRCHRNFFGQNISDLAKQAGLSYDASTFLWRQPFCQGHVDYNGLARFCYSWEDGIHSDKRLPFELCHLGLDAPGMKILNVHPIVIFLNSPGEDYRRPITARYADLTQVPYAELSRDVYTGYGMRDFYREVLAHLKCRGVETFLLKDAAARVARPAQALAG